MAGPAAGRRAAAAHRQPGERHAPALQPRRKVARVPLDARGLVAGVAARARRRRAAQADLARDRRRRVRVAGLGAARARERGLPRVRRRRRLQREAARRGRQGFERAGLRRAAVPALGRLERSPPQPRAVAAARRRHGRGPHPGGRRRSTLQPRRRGLGRVARRQRGLRVAQGREERGLEHERRAVPDPCHGWRRKARLGLARLRQRLPLQPRRAADRLSHAAARGLRVRPLAARGVRPGERQQAHAHRGLRPPGRGGGVLGRLEDTLLHGRGRRPHAGVLGAGRGRRRHAGPGRSRDARRPRGDARRPHARRHAGDAHAPGRGRALRRRRQGPRARDPRQRRAARGLRAAARRERELHGRRAEARAGVGGAAAGLRSREEVPAAGADPRRAAGLLARRLELPLERAGLRERGLRRVHAQPARLDRLRPGVHRRHQRRLGRQGLRGRDEGHRLRGHAAVRRPRAHGGGRGVASAAT